jgi:hypothetical protein
MDYRSANWERQTGNPLNSLRLERESIDLVRQGGEMERPRVAGPLPALKAHSMRRQNAYFEAGLGAAAVGWAGGAGMPDFTL